METKKRRTCYYCRKKKYASLMETVIHRIQLKPFPFHRVSEFHYAVCNKCVKNIEHSTFLNEIVLPERTKQ